MSSSSESVEYQKERYNKEAVDYERHHGDPVNLAYRDRFIRRQLFSFDLTQLQVLDAMAASGIETGFLLERGADVTGLDISEENARLYTRRWDRPCLVRSIHDTGLPDESQDVVYICGGLHHVLPLLDSTITEVHRILRPGGRFCFMEPNRDTWMNAARRLWYRLDPRFHETEEAISYPRQLRPRLKAGFEEVSFSEGGNVAYLFVGQSLVLGIPIWLKRLIYRPLFLVESTIGKLPGIPRLFFTAVWRKTDE